MQKLESVLDRLLDVTHHCAHFASLSVLCFGLTLLLDGTANPQLVAVLEHRSVLLAGYGVLWAVHYVPWTAHVVVCLINGHNPLREAEEPC